MHNYFFTFFNVLFFEDPVEATSFGENATVSQGGNKTFSCPVDGNPQPNITWYRSSEDSGKPICYEKELEARESGCYTCVASNSLGQSISITQCLEMVIKLCLFKIYLFFNEKSHCHLSGASDFL